MNNQQNLKQWQKGQSGNPNGRPVGSKNWSNIIKDLLESTSLIEDLISKKLYSSITEDYRTDTPAKAIGIAIILKALNGDVKAAEWLRKIAYGDKVEINMDKMPPVALVDFVYSGNHRSFRTEEENKALLEVS